MAAHFRNVFTVPALLVFSLLMGQHPAWAQDSLSNSQWITSFYVAYWERAPDAEGHAYWLGKFNRGSLAIPAIAENFAFSDEAKAAYPFFNAPHAATESQVNDFVRSVYGNLLNREVPATDAGVRYWVGELRSGRTTPGAVIGNIIYAAMQSGGNDWQTILTKVRAAEQAMNFNGEIILPSTGAVLAEVRDARGATKATFTGTQTNGAPGLPLREYRIETDQGAMQVTNDAQGRPARILLGAGHILLTHQANDAFAYEYLNGGVLYARGTVGDYAIITKASSVPRGSARSAAIDCSRYPTRVGYEAAVNRLPEVVNLRKNLEALALYWFIAIHNWFHPEFQRLQFEIEYHMVIIDLTIEDVIRQKMEQWDRQCVDVPDDPIPDDPTGTCMLENTEYAFAVNWSGGSQTSFLCSFYPAGWALCNFGDCDWRLQGTDFRLYCEQNAAKDLVYKVEYTGALGASPACRIAGNVKRLDSPSITGTFEATKK